MSCSENTILRVESLSKEFRRYKSEWHRVAHLMGMGVKPIEVHHVMKGISFCVGSGEAVGIVGRNGAGKSTLLKIITGTLNPTEGFVQIAGRVSAILELGMGFHPDLTGRQNVYHSAGLMGYTPAQISEKIDEIEEFAEIGEYFDEPVRMYSSGMQMRVAFAVATAWRPDILIVDEAMSVGDIYFQHKSFSRIKEYREMGTSLLLVSHDRAAIQAVCDRAILLDDGAVLKDSDPEEVMDYYNALIAAKEEEDEEHIEQVRSEDGRLMTLSGDRSVILKSIKLLNSEDNEIEMVSVGERITLEITIEVVKSVDELVLGYMIKDRLAQAVFGTNTHFMDRVIYSPEEGRVLRYRFTFDADMGPGTYSVNTSAHAGYSHVQGNYFWLDNALVFEVVNVDKSGFVGLAWLPPQLEVEDVK